MFYYSHNSGCCRYSVAPWVALQSPHNAHTHTHASCEKKALQIVFCVVNAETRHHAQTHITFGTLVDGAPSLAPCWTNTATYFVGLCWPMLRTAAVQSHNICCSCTWPSNKTGGGVILASSIKFLTRSSLKSRWVNWAPHEDNRIQLLSTVRSRRWKNNFVVHLKLRRHGAQH
jgi:hypothetical protein